MSPNVAFLLLSVATTFVFISAQSTCRKIVHCSCGSTRGNFKICAEKKTTSADPCTRWPGCKSCQGCAEDHSLFTGSLEQRGRLVFCRDPGRMINGNRIPVAAPDHRGFSQGSSLEYSCNQGYMLQGRRSIYCLGSEGWSSAVPRCEEQESGKCGRSFAEESASYIVGKNGIVSLAGEWPWVVSIRENSESEIICGGALLNSRTVVTAAHCLTDSDSYMLYFGKIHKLDKNDDEKVVVRTSNRFIIHPNYSDTTFDSDIGLIHFSDPIRYTDRIRPICLPDTFTTFKNLRSGRIGSVAGFGENERLLQSDHLMYFRLPVQDNKVCVEYYKEQEISLIMSQNMFCAGYPDADQAICLGTGGSALVFFDSATEQYTMEGLVSFSINGKCGTYGYFVFTKVFPYVPWLLANLA